MRKIFFGIIIGSLCTLTISSIATGTWDNINVLKNDISVVVDGNQVTADNFLYNDTTYLSLRAISEALGEQVDYDDETQTAYIGDKKMNENKQEEIIINGTTVICAPPYIWEKDGVTYISYEIMSAVLNISISGDPETMSLKFKMKDGSIKSVPCVVIEDRSCIPLDTFLNEIYPYVEMTE